MGRVGIPVGGARGLRSRVGACPRWGAQWVLAHAQGSGPKDTPKEPQPGGHRLTLELPVGGGLAKAKPPKEFPFWKLGTSPFMTFSREGGRGRDTICVMKSAPGKGLGHGMQVCTGSWARLGEGVCPGVPEFVGSARSQGARASAKQ